MAGAIDNKTRRDAGVLYIYMRITFTDTSLVTFHFFSFFPLSFSFTCRGDSHECYYKPFRGEYEKLLHNG